MYNYEAPRKLKKFNVNVTSQLVIYADEISLLSESKNTAKGYGNRFKHY
jgi:hypothetical protein